MRRITRFAAPLVPLVVLVALAACDGDDDSGAATTTTVRRSTAEEAPLHAGQCGVVPRLQVGGALDPATVEEVPCTQEHNVEISATFDYPAGADVEFPGSAPVDGYATDQCLDRFEGYVGTPYEASAFDVLIVAPDGRGWRQGDRRIACVLYDVDFRMLTTPAGGSGL